MVKIMNWPTFRKAMMIISRARVGVSADGAVTVVSSVWYTINGVRVDGPKQRGIYIRQDLMSDGTKKAVKVLVK